MVQSKYRTQIVAHTSWNCLYTMELLFPVPQCYRHGDTSCSIRQNVGRLSFLIPHAHRAGIIFPSAQDRMHTGREGGSSSQHSSPPADLSQIKTKDRDCCTTRDSLREDISLLCKCSLLLQGKHVPATRYVVALILFVGRCGVEAGYTVNSWLPFL